MVDGQELMLIGQSPTGGKLRIVAGCEPGQGLAHTPPLLLGHETVMRRARLRNSTTRRWYSPPSA